MNTTKSRSVPFPTAAGPTGRSPMRRARNGLLVLGALALGLLAGCGEADKIRDYKVRKEQPREGRRLLAVIAPRGEHTWFFKLVGPTRAVTAQEGTFDRFLQSLRFNGKDVKWTTPDGWQEEPPAPPRYATLRKSEGIPLEITLFVFGKEAARELDNINRWRRRDLGLDAIGLEGLKKVARPLKLDGEQAILVDMASEGEEEPAAPAPAPAPAPAAPIRYKAPKGWKRVPPRGGFAVIELHCEEGGQQARITITPLGGGGGGLLRNVNRWRGEVGLAPIDEKQLGKDVRKFTVDGVEGDYLDLTAPGADAERKRTLVVAASHGELIWFYKMMGPADLVGKQKAAFEEFLKSVKFAGRGGADE